MQRAAANVWLRRYAALFLSLALSGCAAQLAPQYDKPVADGLNAVSAEAMTLFASAAGGTRKESFATREEKYNAVVGKLDALALQAGARPVPQNKFVDAVNKLLDKRGAPPLVDDDATPPSAHAIAQISRTVSKMREVDKMQGVTGTEVELFKRQAAIYFDQAITYENFLQR